MLLGRQCSRTKSTRQCNINTPLKRQGISTTLRRHSMLTTWSKSINAASSRKFRLKGGKDVGSQFRNHNYMWERETTGKTSLNDRKLSEISKLGSGISWKRKKCSKTLRNETLSTYRGVPFCLKSCRLRLEIIRALKISENIKNIALIFRQWRKAVAIFCRVSWSCVFWYS